MNRAFHVLHPPLRELRKRAQVLDKAVRLVNEEFRATSVTDGSSLEDIGHDTSLFSKLVLGCIELTFSEVVNPESGSIYIKKSSDDSLVESIDVNSSQVTGSGTNVITINPTNDFESFTKYYLQIDASAFDDPSSNSFSGINDETSLSFTTADVVSSTLSSSNPAANAANVAVDSNIELTFSEAVATESGSIYIKKSNIGRAHV